MRQRYSKWLFFLDAIDPSSKLYSSTQVMRIMVMMFFIDFFDEQHQVNGSTIVNDVSNFSMKHQTFFPIDEAIKAMKMWQVIL